MKSSHIAFAGLLAVLPLSGALAQQTTGSGMKADNMAEVRDMPSAKAMDTSKPGATGMTTVKGTNSTVQGDEKSTDMKRTGGGGGSSR